MKDELDVLERVLRVFSLRLTGWTIAVFLLIFILRERLRTLASIPGAERS
jgi:hypothetical protein